uniref:Putative amidase C869.01 n=1 Tax=Anthurium amnicola TaxID=1678845 RepID=A0A1D1ZKT2_9ARAE
MAAAAAAGLLPCRPSSSKPKMGSPPPLVAAGAAVMVVLLTVVGVAPPCHGFEFQEATVDDLRAAFSNGTLTSRQAVEYYQGAIRALNPRLHAVIEENPDALSQADRADAEMKKKKRRRRGGRDGRGVELRGVPVLLKDNIATDDGLNTTAGSLALLGSRVPRDAFVVRKLRRAGAVIMGKASLSEWSGARSTAAPPGWSARGGQGMNPYTGDKNVCGSSSGSATSVGANTVAVSLGTETDGSVLCPAAHHSCVGIKPTVGLTSRDGVVPISERQHTVGVIARTVSDAVRVLDVIVGRDPNDPATRRADGWIPLGKYGPPLKRDGLKHKRLGILRHPSFFTHPRGSPVAQTFENHFNKLRDEGAVVVDNIISLNQTVEISQSETDALLIELKLSLNKYLKKLKSSRVRSLGDVIRFNENNKEEKIAEYGQDFLTAANGSNASDLNKARGYLKRYVKAGLVKVMTDEKLDAVVIPTETCTGVLAVGGFPGITVPAGYNEDVNGLPFGICFGGLRGTEAKLIEIAYAFEQATKVRRPPPAVTPTTTTAPN